MISMDCCTFFVTISEACFRIVFFSAVSIIEKCLCLFGSRWFTIHQWIKFNQVLNRNRPALMAATLRAAYGTGPQTRTPVTPSVSATPHTPRGASLAPQDNPRTPANTARKAFLWEAASKSQHFADPSSIKSLQDASGPFWAKITEVGNEVSKTLQRFSFCHSIHLCNQMCLRVDMCFSPRPGECYPFVCKHQQSVSWVGGQCVWRCQ